MTTVKTCHGRHCEDTLAVSIHVHLIKELLCLLFSLTFGLPTMRTSSLIYYHPWLHHVKGLWPFGNLKTSLQDIFKATFGVYLPFQFFWNSGFRNTSNDRSVIYRNNLYLWTSVTCASVYSFINQRLSRKTRQFSLSNGENLTQELAIQVIEQRRQTNQNTITPKDRRAIGGSNIIR